MLEDSSEYFKTVFASLCEVGIARLGHTGRLEEDWEPLDQLWEGLTVEHESDGFPVGFDCQTDELGVFAGQHALAESREHLELDAVEGDAVGLVGELVAAGKREDEVDQAHGLTVVGHLVKPTREQVHDLPALGNVLQRDHLDDRAVQLEKDRGALSSKHCLENIVAHHRAVLLAQHVPAPLRLVALVGPPVFDLLGEVRQRRLLNLDRELGCGHDLHEVGTVARLKTGLPDELGGRSDGLAVRLEGLCKRFNNLVHQMIRYTDSVESTLMIKKSLEKQYRPSSLLKALPRNKSQKEALSTHDAKCGLPPVSPVPPRLPRLKTTLPLPSKQIKHQLPTIVDCPTLPTIQKSVISEIKGAPVIAYAVNTHRGLVRKVNEDCISIIQNCVVNGQLYHLFGLYDGHGGSKVAHYLSAHLGKLIFSSQHFPKDMNKAILAAFYKAQQTCLNQLLELHPDRSGSCALIAIVSDHDVWVANLGDSRALLLSRQMEWQLTTDHRPNQPSQRTRIEKSGGHVYRLTKQDKPEQFIGPFRVRPGGLSVSRTLGDIGSKLPEFGGLPGSIIAEPEMFHLQLKQQQQVQLLLGCDGIFQHLSNQTILTQIRKTRVSCKGQPTNLQLGATVDSLLKLCMSSGSHDNLSAILIKLVRKS